MGRRETTLAVRRVRLALRVAAQVREAFPAEVWLVELATLAEDNLLPQAGYCNWPRGLVGMSARPCVRLPIQLGECV